jgi:D-alanyl-D-alanine carboxypeptidase (penicillin-binding protein 5/6)
MHSPTLWPYATQLLDWGFKARGKVTPVGKLVDPVDARAAQPRHTGGTGGVPFSRLTVKNDSGDDSWMLPAAGAGAAAVLAGGLTLTVRRRHRRRRIATVSGPRAAGYPPAEDYPFAEDYPPDRR